MLESYIQGYNLEYKSSCSFRDSEGNLVSCDDKIKHNETQLTFQFPIDFVTNERQVYQAFPIDDLYMMLDT
jgi:hypothetical protein